VPGEELHQLGVLKDSDSAAMAILQPGGLEIALVDDFQLKFILWERIVGFYY
jgi:hypothetical protein